MKQEEIYQYFKIWFPQIAQGVTEWFPNGKNSIRVRLTVDLDLIFTYEGPNNWKFETVGSFLKTLKEENNNGRND